MTILIKQILFDGVVVVDVDVVDVVVDVDVVDAVVDGVDVVDVIDVDVNDVAHHDQPIL